MNRTSLLLPFPEQLSWTSRLVASSLQLEGSLAAVLTLAPVIPLFPPAANADRTARRHSRKRG